MYWQAVLLYIYINIGFTHIPGISLKIVRFGIEFYDIQNVSLAIFLCYIEYLADLHHSLTQNHVEKRLTEARESQTPLRTSSIMSKHYNMYYAYCFMKHLSRG